MSKLKNKMLSEKGAKIKENHSFIYDGKTFNLKKGEYLNEIEYKEFLINLQQKGII